MEVTLNSTRILFEDYYGSKSKARQAYKEEMIRRLKSGTVE